MRLILLILLALITTPTLARSAGVISFTGRIVTTDEVLDSIKVVDASTSDQPKYLVYELGEQIASFDNRKSANDFAAYRRWLLTHSA